MFGSQRAAISNCKQSMRMNPQTVIGNWSASSRNLDLKSRLRIFFFCTRLFFQFVTSSNFRPRIFFSIGSRIIEKWNSNFFWSGSIKYNFRIIFCKSRLIFCFWNNISLSGYFDRNGTPYASNGNPFKGSCQDLANKKQPIQSGQTANYCSC